MIKNNYHTAKHLLQNALKKHLGTKEDRQLLQNENTNKILSKANEALSQTNNFAVKMMIFNKVRSFMSKEAAEKYTMKKFEQDINKTHLTE